jgi:hypothetical protein
LGESLWNQVMALDFPNAPTNGQQFTGVGGTPVWQWDGTKWVAATPGAVTEAPQDGIYYTRRNAVWTNVNNDAVAYAVTQSLTLPQQAVALRNIGAAQNNLINGYLVENHAANAATYSIKTWQGSDPSPTDPVICVSAISFGGAVTITAPTSLTIPSGTTIGTRSGQPFRLWFALAIPGGANPPVLVVRRCSDFINMNTTGAGIALISGFPVTGLLSAAAIGAGSNSAATNYGSGIVNNNSFCVIAFADYDSGLATAGTWNAGPNRIPPVGPSTPLPGYVIQTAMASKGASSTTSSAWVSSGLSVTLSPTCVCNYFDVRADYDSFVPSVSTQPQARICRNTATTFVSGAYVGAYTNAGPGGTSSYTSSAGSAAAMDAPFTVSSTTYLLGIATSVNGNSMSTPANYGSIRASEIMA